MCLGTTIPRAVRQTKEASASTLLRVKRLRVSSSSQLILPFCLVLLSPFSNPHHQRLLLIDTNSRNFPFLTPSPQLLCLQLHNHMKSYSTSQMIHMTAQRSSYCGIMAEILAQLFCYILEKASLWSSRQVPCINMLSNHIPRSPT